MCHPPVTTSTFPELGWLTYGKKIALEIFCHRSYYMVIGFNLSTMVGVAIKPLIIIPPFMYATSIKLFHPVWKMTGKNTNDPLMLHPLSKSFLKFITGCYHELISGSQFSPYLFFTGNNETIQSMLGKSSSGSGLGRHSTFCSMIWVGHPYHNYHTGWPTIKLQKNHNFSVIHCNIFQSLLHWYTHCCYQWY